MYLKLGNPQSKEGYKQEAAADASREDLEAEARSLEVLLDDDPSDALLRARIEGATRHRPLEGDRVTSIAFPPGLSLAEAFVTVAGARGIWSQHAEGDAKPTWVESDDEVLAQMIAREYGCPIGAPDDVEETHYTASGPPGTGPDGPIESTGSGKKGGKR